MPSSSEPPVPMNPLYETARPPADAPPEAALPRDPKQSAKKSKLASVRRVRRRRLACSVLYLAPLPLIVAGPWLASSVASLYGRATAWLAIGAVYLFSGFLIDLSLRRSRWKRLRTGLAKAISEKRRSVCLKRGTYSLAVYLVLFVPLSVGYLWAETFVTLFPRGVQGFLSSHSRWLVVITFLFAYLLGLVIRDVLRYGVRMFKAPLVVACILLFGLLVAVVDTRGRDWVHETLKIFKDNVWLIPFLATLILLRPQLARLLPRVQKAELPGGAKFEIENLDELQRQLNPWKKTISRFADLMRWVTELIEQTPEEDTVKFLAYTPALGFLTRPEKDWVRLHKMLVERDNVQIICLRNEDLKSWHQSFLDKRTARPEGIIKQSLINRSNSISERLLADKKMQYNQNLTPVVEKAWDEMPGYYLFANKTRAIIAAPLFLPGDPKKQGAQEDPDSYLRNTPVKMLGFESTDNWTVWMVNEVCDHYARTSFVRTDFGEASCVVPLETLEQSLGKTDPTVVMQQLFQQLTSSYERARQESPGRFNGSAPDELELVLSARAKPAGIYKGGASGR